MRSSKLALAAALGLAAGLGAPGVPARAADPAAPAAAASPSEAVPAPEAEAVAEAPAETADAPAPAPREKHVVELGPVGRDDQGRSGRLHVVTRGDTLWDISDAYLGTPWVWPSIWKDNDEIANPHRIFPGDNIWITPSEMRRVTPEEAAELLAAGDAAPPAALESVDGVPGGELAGRTFNVSLIETLGFVTADELAGMATIVSSPETQTWLGDHDRVVVGLGAGAVAKGDRLDIFRRGEAVFDPDTDVLFGYATEELGWLEITDVHAQSASGIIRMSRSEIHVGDHVIPRARPDSEIQVLAGPAVEGRVVHTPGQLMMGSHGVVYLDRGHGDGLQVGHPLEIYRDMGSARDEVRGTQVDLPDDVVAKLLVVETTESTATALVTHTRAELASGDRFRGTRSLAW